MILQHDKHDPNVEDVGTVCNFVHFKVYVQIVFLLPAYQSEPPEFFLACFCVVLCEPLFDSLSDFVWPLYCLSFDNVFYQVSY
jgi:hypothetical protein